MHRGTLGGGELLLPGEIVLGPGQEYRAPTVYYAWSGEGLDGIAGAFHAMLRGRAAHPPRPRPLLVNTWEAVYFDHDVTRLLSLIDKAAAVGASGSCLTTAGSTACGTPATGWGTGSSTRTSGPTACGPS